MQQQPQEGDGETAVNVKIFERLSEEEQARLLADLARSRNGSEPESEPEPVEKFHRTDLGNAERLVHQFGQDIIHVRRWGAWYVWNGAYWQLDETGHVRRMAIETVRRIYQEAAAAVDDDERVKLGKWALASESRGRLEAMIDLATDLADVATHYEALDRDQWLLNCNNGTLDLRTGELLPHERGRLITKSIGIDYDPSATCPRWLAFLDRIMAGNEDMIGYLQRAVGYSLTGDTSEQCLFFLYGTGRNGKSTFIETISALLGDYWAKTPTDTILVKSSAIPNDIARLPGVRVVVAAELDAGRRISESLVKDLTGGDTISARFLHQEFFEFKPVFKLWIYGNHKPVIRGTDEGIWRRIRLIPFTVTIPESEADTSLPRKLTAELPGILAWAVRGCLDWQQAGLGAPAAVKQATAAYRQEMDVIAAFLDDCCVLDAAASVKVSDLYQAYNKWCAESGEHAVNNRVFGMRLDEKGFDKTRRTVAGNTAWWRIGIGLLANDLNDPK